MKIIHLLRTAILATTLTFGVLALPSVALAQDSAVVVDQHSQIVLTPVAVTILTGLLMPFLIGVVYRFLKNSSSRVKGVVALLLAAVAALIERAVMVDGSAVFSWALLLDVGLVYGPQLGTYLGIWGHPNKDGLTLNAKLAGSPPG